MSVAFALCKILALLCIIIACSEARKKQLLGRGYHDYAHIGVFRKFTEDFNKTYSSPNEFENRFKIFRHNMRKVTIFQRNEKGNAQYGVTKFADLTGKEFRKMLGFRPHLKPENSAMTSAIIPDISLPKEFDWRDHDIVTPVKNQGMCGSCWAFSVTGNIEGQWALQNSNLFSLSEQELIDCDTTDQGCNGGLPENAYKSIEALGGLETESAYPYEGKDDTCSLALKKIKVQVNGSVELPSNETAMAKWLLKNGPISIGINANAMQFYMGGVSHPYSFLCSPDNLDHGVLIVGFGVHTSFFFHNAVPYWTIKNSWGADWGEQGYYRVYRGGGTCGLNLMATSAVVP